MARDVGALLLAILGIISVLFATDDEITFGQTDSQISTVEKWEGVKFAQLTSVQEQVAFSELAQKLQTKISERETYLAGLLQTLNANPPAEGTGGESFTSECVIATAAFGSNLAPQVQFLREFRDSRIVSTLAGSSFLQVFNHWYYSFSPSIAEYERGQPWLQQVVRIAIIPLLSILQFSENGYSIFDGEVGAIAAGFIASSLIGTVYFGPIALTIVIRPGYITRIILLSLILAGSGLFMILAGILLASSAVLMVATAVFVLGILIASATSVAKLLHVIFGGNTPLLKRLQVSRTSALSAILITAILCSSAMAGPATASVSEESTLSRQEVEDQLTQLSEIKTWLEDMRRIESLFPETIQAHEATGNLIGFIRGYSAPGSQLTDAAFLEGLQAASNEYQKISSRIYNDGVSDQHFTLKDTLSSAVLQLSYSTGDLVRVRTCDCDAQELSELFASSELALETSRQNFYSYSQMLLSEGNQIQSRITDIELMPNS